MEERKCNYCLRPYIAGSDKTCHGCGAPILTMEHLREYQRPIRTMASSCYITRDFSTMTAMTESA